MVAPVELPPSDYRDADLTIGDTNPIHGCFVWWDGFVVRAQDRSGISLGELEVPANGDGKRMAEQLDGKTFRFTGTDGTQWTVYKRGCGCGG